LKGRTVLVTGAQGFAGSWLARALLEEGAEVIAYDRGDPAVSGLALQEIEDEVELIRGDLSDRELIGRTIGERGVDAVFHLAAQTIVGEANASPLPTFESNIRGTWSVLEACREGEVRTVIVASSDKAYGPHEQLPYREDAPLKPIYPYDASKAAAELIARSYWHTYELPVAVTRFANLYGGGDLNFSRLIPEAVSALLDGRRPVIRSDGSPERDFLYVEDAAAAYVAIARTLDEGRGRGEAFNAGGGEPHSVREVLQLLCEVAGTDVDPDIRGEGNPPGEIDRQYLDSTKITQVTGWQPEVDLHEGLTRTLDWYRSRPEARAPAPA
jgi:CDP-glucose 4,6-dehydratase